jgi:hypothetical protein
MDERAMGVISLMMIGDDGVDLEEQNSTHGIAPKNVRPKPFPPWSSGWVKLLVKILFLW